MAAPFSFTISLTEAQATTCLELFGTEARVKGAAIRALRTDVEERLIEKRLSEVQPVPEQTGFS